MPIINGKRYIVDKKNPNLPILQEALRKNDRQCPCVPRYAWTEDTRCPCKVFRETGDCQCGLYVEEKKGT